MRAFLPEYHLECANSLTKALELLEKDPLKWKVFAGGTDLMVLLESGKLQHKNFLDISLFSELRKIEEFPSEIRIGSLVTYAEIQSCGIIRKEFPLVTQAAKLTGAKAIQNRATIGGNIANASPAADTPPALLAYDVKLEIISNNKKRIASYSDFHQNYKKMDLATNEIISAVILPRTIQWTHHYYKKVGTRAYQAISKVAVCGAAKIENKKILSIGIGLASVAAFPYRFKELENFLCGQEVGAVDFSQVEKIVDQSIKPLDDVRSSAKYRQRVLKNLIFDFITFEQNLHLET